MKKLFIAAIALIIGSTCFAGNVVLDTALQNNYKVLVDSSGNLGFAGNLKQKILIKSSDYTYAPGDGILLVNSTAGAVTVTLPAITTWADSAYRYTIPIVHFAGTNNVKVQLSGTEKFAWGNSYFNLGTALRSMDFGATNYGSMEKYGILRNITIKASAERTTTWAASNFNSMTVIPWNAEGYNNQPEFFVYTSGASARYTILTSGSYKIGYQVDVESTGGSTWQATTQIFKNGTAITSPNTSVSSGNYSKEDQVFPFIPKYIDLEAGDYVDLRIDHNNLTGNLIRAVFSIEIRL